ncbi:MAG: DUF6141 family protein [Methanofollis sp.]|uniref:DUF6141 family protein n=1 Tax=Methanofollis sp. TaxID=2052835 RepID=UPI0026051B2C|nr:DUF6141 family protein [Methanofollis sp.]MDD4253891.1 DUF6141 family protein [Methanofollis sp.]
MTEGAPLFRETQRFTQPWLWAVLILIAGVAWWGAVQQLYFSVPFGNRPAPDWAMAVITLVFGTLFPLFFAVIHLTVEVRDGGIAYRFFPFHLSFRVIPATDVERLEACTYRPLTEFGGWGIRWGAGGWRAYTTGGDRGVRVYLRNGRKILFGSRDPEGFVAAVRAVQGRRT